ncbi:MAG: GNAT family N-acetyltransferase [Anaerolineae bacterium]|nr:GNAT family N-acetyltransferase [Anaerolineae bacterium]
MYYHGSKVCLRPPERTDLKKFVAWLSHPDLRQTTSTRYVSEALEERWFESALERISGSAPSLLHYVIETLDGNVPIGFCSLMDINWRDRNAEAGIVVGDATARGKGYGTDAMLVLLEVAFKWYQLHRVYLHVLSDNERAIRSYEKCGFVREGELRETVFVDGTYRNMLLMSILERESEGEAHG